MPDPPRKPESSRAFETHADDAKPTGIRRYINILAIVVPILIALVLVLIIVHSLNEPASNPSPTASTEPSPTPSTPSPTPTTDATPPATTPAPAPAPVATRPPTPSPKPGPATKSIPAAAPASADQIFTIPMEAAAAMRISGDSAVVPANRQRRRDPRNCGPRNHDLQNRDRRGRENRQRPNLAPERGSRRRQNVSLSALPDERKASPRPHPGGCDFHAPLRRQQLYCPLSVDLIKPPHPRETASAHLPSRRSCARPRSSGS